MHNLTPGGNVPSRIEELPVGAVEVGEGLERHGVVISPAVMSLRRLRYFIDLLVAGHHHALNPEPLFPSLRGERIALGIDLPELDTVPLWSARRADGAVSIPFIEFILGQIDQGVDAICGDPASASSPDARNLLRGRRALARVIKEVSPKGDPAPAFPRLRDLFVPGPLLDELCGPGGLTDQILQHCESLLAAGSSVPGH